MFDCEDGLQAWLPHLRKGDAQALRAVARLGGRTGAREFQFSCQHPDKPYRKRSWWALVVYDGGVRLMADGHDSPQAACDALAARILDGGQCLGCGKFSFVYCEDGYRLPDEAAVARVQREGLCRWRRDGQVWRRGCGESAPPDSTRERLAEALKAAQVIPAEQIAAARSGRYDEWLTQDTPFPLLLLIDELRPYGQAGAALIERVKNGEFDGTEQESQAWAQSPEGRDTFAQLEKELDLSLGEALKSVRRTRGRRPRGRRRR